MYDRLHFVPLIKFECILSDISAEGSGSVTVGPVTLRQLGLIVDAIRLHEALQVAPRLVEAVLHLIHKREVISLCQILAGGKTCVLH
jgi:hypothetical protein